MLVLDLLDKSDIKYFFDQKATNENTSFKHDDLLTYCKDLSSRAIHSLIIDKLEEENDALGLRALRITMIVYFLNRKTTVQDSKYARCLLFDLVLELSSSERTRQRMDNYVCVNPRGQPGQAIFRDKQNEIFVKADKAALRGLHSNIADIDVLKTVGALSSISAIIKHDRDSMLFKSSSSTTSHDYIGNERRDIIGKEVAKVDPFGVDRDKVELYDKSRGSSPYHGLTADWLTTFVERNRSNFKRIFWNIHTL